MSRYSVALKDIIANTRINPLYYSVDVIKEAIEKAEKYDELGKRSEEDYYVIYCVNRHNTFMNHRGEFRSFAEATKFKNELEAHEFLRKYGNDKFYRWLVYHIKDLVKENKI